MRQVNGEGGGCLLDEIFFFFASPSGKLPPLVGMKSDWPTKTVTFLQPPLRWRCEITGVVDDVKLSSPIIITSTLLKDQTWSGLMLLHDNLMIRLSRVKNLSSHLVKQKRGRRWIGPLISGDADAPSPS